MPIQALDNYNDIPLQEMTAANENSENRKLLHLAGLTMSDGITLNPEQTAKFQELCHLLHELDVRANFYLDVPHYTDHHTWFQKSTGVTTKLKRVNLTLSALRELAASPLENKDSISEVLLLMLEADLLNLKMNQLRKIANNQEITRNELDHLRASYYDNLVKINDKISEIDTSQFSPTNQPTLSRLFSYQKRLSMNIKRYIGTMDKVSDANKAASAPYTIFSTLSTVTPMVISIGKIIGTFLLAIPLVGAIMTALPLVAGAVRSWVKNQNTTKKTIATAAVVIVIGGIIIAGAVTVAAAGVVCGLLTLGILVNNVKPWREARNLVIKREKELAYLEDRIPKLLDQSQTITLDNREKNALLKAMEDYCIHCAQAGIPYNETKFAQARKLVIQGDKAALTINECVNLSLQHAKVDNLNEFLIQNAINTRINLNAELMTLRYKRNYEGLKMGVGLITIVGAVLLCIPSPPTMILGAALLCGSQVAGVVLKYELHTKCKKLLGNLFNKLKHSLSATDRDQAPSPQNAVTLNAPLRSSISMAKPEMDPKDVFTAAASSDTIKISPPKAAPADAMPSPAATVAPMKTASTTDSLQFNYNRLFVERKKSDESESNHRKVSTVKKRT